MLTKLAALLRPLASRIAPALLSLIGIAFLVSAAWQISTTWGLAATGGGVLLLELTLTPDQRGDRR